MYRHYLSCVSDRVFNQAMRHVKQDDPFTKRTDRELEEATYAHLEREESHITRGEN